MKASEHISQSTVKLLLLGDSGSGKTTALASLVKAGYKLRIWDFDNLLASLIAKLRRECSDLLDTVEFVTLRDKMKSSAVGPVLDGVPQAFTKGIEYFDKWTDGTQPNSWDASHVIVVDSLTLMAQRAAWNWAKMMQGASLSADGVPSKGVSPQAIYHTAQQALMNVIATMTSEACKANVIYIAHIKYLERDGFTKGFPVAVGNAISPEIPAYFPSVALVTKDGYGDKVQRYLQTVSTNTIDLKNPQWFDMSPRIELENGLAEFFAKSIL